MSGNHCLPYAPSKISINKGTYKCFCCGKNIKKDEVQNEITQNQESANNEEQKQNKDNQEKSTSRQEKKNNKNYAFLHKNY